jgi:hypothetical protein
MEYIGKNFTDKYKIKHITKNRGESGYYIVFYTEITYDYSKYFPTEHEYMFVKLQDIINYNNRYTYGFDKQTSRKKKLNALLVKEEYDNFKNI